MNYRHAMKAAGRTLAVAALVVGNLIGLASGQDGYPSEPIHIIVGYSAGGATDLTARLIGERLSEQMGVPVVIENRTGAGGQIANEYVAKSKPDGYTVGYHDGAMLSAPALGMKLGYDWKKDIRPVAVALSVPHFLYAHPDVPADTIEEFVQYLRDNSGKVYYASSGVGTPNHLSPLLFLQANDLSAIHTPYKGQASSMTDVLAGRVQFGMTSATGTVPMATEGRIKALAYAGAKRSPLLPDVPTFDETIMPGFRAGNWFDFAVAAGTPDEIVTKLNAAILKVLNNQALIDRLAQEGAEVIGLSPEESAKFLQSEAERFKTVIERADIKLQ